MKTLYDMLGELEDRHEGVSPLEYVVLNCDR